MASRSELGQDSVVAGTIDNIANDGADQRLVRGITSNTRFLPFVLFLVALSVVLQFARFDASGKRIDTFETTTETITQPVGTPV